VPTMEEVAVSETDTDSLVASTRRNVDQDLGELESVTDDGAISMKLQEAASLAHMQESDSDHSSPLLDLFKEGVTCEGKFDLRMSGVGRRWSKEVKQDAELKHEYAKQKNNEARAQFRKEWAGRKLHELTVSKSHLKEYQKVDVTKGRYMDFGSLVETFGILYDRERAIACAMRHAAKCIKMGGMWLSHDPLAEVTEFLKLSKGFEETMMEAWRLCEKEHSTEKLPSPDVQKPNPDCLSTPSRLHATGDKAETITASPDGVEGKRKRGQPDTRDEAGAKHAKTKTELELALTEAGKTKALYLQAMPKAEQVVHSINKDANWCWARSEQSLGQLEQMMSTICDKMTPLVNRFVLEDIKQLKHEIGNDTLLLAAAEFNGLSALLAKIDKKQSSLVKAHKVMNA
jgi:hypothetical protein